MGLIDFFLNLAALLLWVSWRSAGFAPLVKGAGQTAPADVRRAERAAAQRWRFLGGLLGLLLLRALIYWQIGGPVGWTPNLRFSAVAVPLRSDMPERMLLFSFLSFGVTLAVFYLWLLCLSLVNGRPVEPNPLHRLVALHLGRVERWPWPLKLLLPPVAGAALWLLLRLVLLRMHLLPPAASNVHCFQQALIIGLGTYLSWPYLLASVLLLSMLASYVYLGAHPFWQFVGATGGNLILPLQRLPLRFGSFDFTPLILLVLLLFAAAGAEHGLALWYRQLPL